MTVGQLKERLKDIPDHAHIVVPRPDHSYDFAAVRFETGLFDKDSQTWSEDYGEAQTPEADYGRRLPIIVVT